MVQGHYEPYPGELDANNHFLNSFLGSIFISTFGHNNNWTFRLPNVLAFGLYLWTIAGIAAQTGSKIKFWAILSTLTLSSFLLEYFSLARGYELSLAFLFTAIFLSTAKLISKENLRTASVFVCWGLAIYSNQSLIPMAIIACVLFSIAQFKKQRLQSLLA